VVAFAAARGGGAPVRGLLVGDGTTRARVDARVRRAGLQGVVLMPGRVPHDEVVDYYHLIDVFVVPRIDAPIASMVTPLKPLEAMATGRPIVVSRLPALLELVNDGTTGLSYAPGSRAELSARIGELSASPDERARLANAARDWVVDHRSLASMGGQYRELYERLGAA
jgi:glycosyltransferase involved in cell wall biosynthesis